MYHTDLKGGFVGLLMNPVSQPPELLRFQLYNWLGATMDVEAYVCDGDVFPVPMGMERDNRWE